MIFFQQVLLRVYRLKIKFMIIFFGSNMTTCFKVQSYMSIVYVGKITSFKIE